MSLTLPRLGHQQQQQAIQRIRQGMTPASLAHELPWRPENRTWPATGPARITESQLVALRTALVATASETGYPHGRGGPSFDGPAARILRIHLPLTPHEASHSAAWAYLNCCWLLDISVWRWGNDGEVRHFNGDLNRDTFRRLWWRAELFGDGFDLSRLAEDEQVSLAERPQLPRHLVRTLAAEFLSHETVVHAQLQRTQLMRDVAKRLLRSTPLIEYAALTPVDLRAEARAALDASAAALMGRPQPLQATSPLTVATLPVDARVPAASTQVRQLHSVGVESETQPRPSAINPYRRAAAAETGKDSDWSVAEKVAMAVARRNGRVTTADLAQLMHTTTHEAGRVLQQLVGAGLLEARGRTRGTYYVLPISAVPTEQSSPQRTDGEEMAALRGVIRTTTAPTTSILHQLLGAGLVHPGELLRARAKGALRRVTILPDGNVNPADKTWVVLDLSEATNQLSAVGQDPADVWAVERDGYLKPLRDLLATPSRDIDASVSIDYHQPGQQSDVEVEITIDLLTSIARAQRLISYSELNRALAAATNGRPFDFGSGAQRAAMGRLLEKVSRRSLQTDGVLLSAVVTYINANDAGTGFYNLAVNLGLLATDATLKRREEFWVTQVQAAYRAFDSPIS